MSRNDLISRGEFANAISNLWEKGEILAVLQGMETADPVRHGHWIDYIPELDNYRLEGLHKCSRCKLWSERKIPYCGYCGTKMDEVSE